MDRDVDAFVKNLCQTADDKGMRFLMRDPTKIYADPNWDRDEIFKRLHKEYVPGYTRKGKLDLLLVVTPAKPSQQYTPVKRYCDCVGIASQCVAKFNVKRKSGDKGFACNMLMKINSKLGGVNVTLRELPPWLRNGTVHLF
jgi:hypothetical protein